MNFDFTEEQALLRASVERFCLDRHGGDLANRRRYRAADGGFDRAGWTLLGELGLLALPFAVKDGGLGGGPVDLIAVAEPLGRGLAVEPFTECLVPMASLLGGTAPDLLAGVMTGALLVAPAITEAGGRINPVHVETRARADGDGYVLAGAKSAVWQGGAADWYLLSARLEGDVRGRDGIGLFLVRAGAHGLERRDWRAIDGQLACELVLHDVGVPGAARLAAADAAAAMELAVSQAWLCASAEMLGIAGLLFDAVLSYVKTRQQFGRPLGSFQVIQHRLTDAYVALEQARSMVYRAALAPDADRMRAVAGTRAFVGEAARAIAHDAVQFHGGMGVTDELVVGHGLKRIQFLSRLWGDPDDAAEQWARAA